jgi:hypothetical protein
MDVHRGRSELMGVLFVIWDQRTAGSRRFIFFEMRHAAAPAFKRTYIGQSAETLRPSNQSHVLSAAWAQRQLRPRASRMHDEARFNAIHAQLHWPTKTDGTLNHYNEWPPVSCSVRTWVARPGAHCMLRLPNLPLFHCADAVNPAKRPKWSIPLSPWASDLLVASHTDKRRAWIAFSWLGLVALYTSIGRRFLLPCTTHPLVCTH